MLILITYDVNTETKEGKRRLRKMSKACLDVGQRVQNSVFECNVDSSQLRVLENTLIGIMNPKEDSLRIYNLGNNYKNHIFHYGTKPSFDVTEPLIL